MPPQPIESRVKSLARRVTQLEQLPARIDALTSQVSLLRTEVRVEFSAVRGEMVAQSATIIATLRTEMAEQGEGLRKQFRTEIGSLATHMRVLHEDVVSRIAQLQEGWPARPRRKLKAR